MNTNLKKTIASGVIGLTALSGGAVALPGLAAAQDEPAVEVEATEFVIPNGERDGRSFDRDGRRANRAERLQGLVEDGTITQEQADTVAERVRNHRGRSDRGQGQRGERHRGHRNLAVATEVLGVDAEELRSSLRSGETLADVAAEQGVSIDALTAALVDAKTDRLAELVDAGRITQDEADAKQAELEARITARINGERPERGRLGG